MFTIMYPLSLRWFCLFTLAPPPDQLYEDRSHVWLGTTKSSVPYTEPGRVEYRKVSMNLHFHHENIQSNLDYIEHLGSCHCSILIKGKKLSSAIVLPDSHRNLGILCVTSSITQPFFTWIYLPCFPSLRQQILLINCLKKSLGILWLAPQGCENVGEGLGKLELSKFLIKSWMNLEDIMLNKPGRETNTAWWHSYMDSKILISKKRTE